MNSNSSENPDIIYYRCRDGTYLNFDTGISACEPFGFYSGYFVITPKGKAKVIGVAQNCLWFHVEGDSGASFWDNCKNYEDLLNLGVRLFPIPEPDPDDIAGEYRLKALDIPHINHSLNILLQNQNGPCPFIAISNVLALRESIRVEEKRNRISVSQVVSLIENFLSESTATSLSKSETFPESSSIFVSVSARKRAPVLSADEIKYIVDYLPSLQFGLDVNFGFTSCGSFETTSKMKVFDSLGIRLVHGWLVDPSSPVSKAIGNSTYNDLTLQIVTLREQNAKKETEMVPLGIPTIDSASSPTVEASIKVSEVPKAMSKEKEESKDLSVRLEEKELCKLTLEEGAMIEEFLNSNCNQLTEYGLRKLHEELEEGELVILFRNNHFSTLTKNNGRLFNLATDIGYEKERHIVWDLLESVGGDSMFYTSQFLTIEEAKREETFQTALQFGFERKEVEEAIQKCSQNNTVNTDDVLQWLNKNAIPRF